MISVVVILNLKSVTWDPMPLKMMTSARNGSPPSMREDGSGGAQREDAETFPV